MTAITGGTNTTGYAITNQQYRGGTPGRANAELVVAGGRRMGDRTVSLDLDVQGLLRGNQVQEINFQMDRIRVSGLGFAALSNLFTDRPIRERVHVVVNPNVLGPRTEALYRPSGGNTIVVRSPTVMATLAGRATLVHECTHAQVDLRGLPTNVPAGEAVAFIAEAWFLLACAGDNIDKIVPDFAPAIVDIAKDLRARSRPSGRPEVVRTSRGKPVEMSRYQTAVAHEIVLQYYRYERGFYEGNGIWGRFYRGE